MINAEATNHIKEAARLEITDFPHFANCDNQLIDRHLCQAVPIGVTSRFLSIKATDRFQLNHFLSDIHHVKRIHA